MPFVFASIPNNLFYMRADISAFILENNYSPLNPYMNFDYNLMNTAPKDKIRIANNSLIRHSDELWIFAEDFNNLTDGVIFEIYFAKELKKKIKYFEMPGFKEKEINIDIKIDDIKDYYGYKLRDKVQKLAYTAMSIKLFYFRTYISKFTLNQGIVPLNPFMSFDYFLVDLVDRKNILEANFNFVNSSDELWVFGKASDGVLAEVKSAKEHNKQVRYFKQVHKK